MILTNVQVATGRKTALMSVIGCRTDETDLNGVMEEAEGYENITVFSECKQYDVEFGGEQTANDHKVLVERHPAVARKVQTQQDK